jgi:hypothetical protein
MDGQVFSVASEAIRLQNSDLMAKRNVFQLRAARLFTKDETTTSIIAIHSIV